ncbi:nucleotidyl transferase AbiEii/AbiGii toxin family protein [Luteolibacter sp. Populi]|uniref:nucleotidyl transferase AbiEii/AbiGii toxin family protein n=1 Tax=Luteolibacter sp. Populi TaxID=3230487 RepID=UPI003467C33E
MLHFDAVPAQVAELLMQLAPRPCLAGFRLAGGTSLALRFSHRLSVDLDFFTTGSFDPEELYLDLALPEAVVVARSEGTLSLDAGGTKLDFLRHAYPLIEEPEETDGVHLLSVPDVAAMKLNAIANRGSKKDFFDLCELMKRHSLEEMLGFFESKYRNSDRFIVLRSLAWFDDAESEPDPLSKNGLTWTEAKDRIARSLRELR